MGIRVGIAPIGTKDGAVAVMGLYREGPEAAGPQDADDPCQHRGQIRHVDQHVGGQAQIDRSRGLARQERREITLGQAVVERPAVMRLGSSQSQHPGGEIDPGKMPDTLADRRAHQAGAAAKIERRVEPLRLGRQGVHDELGADIAQPVHQMALEARGVAVEQGPDISRRQGRQIAAFAQADEMRPDAKGIVGIDIQGAGISPRRRRPQRRIVALDGQSLPGAAQQEPGRRVAGRDLQRLLGEIGGPGMIAVCQAGLGVAIAAVGEEVAGTVLRGHASAGSGPPIYRGHRRTPPAATDPMPTRASDLLTLTREGLYCPLGGFHVDPTWPVERALITHGHADHARAGHGHVLATPETLRIMAVRYGEDFCRQRQEARLGEALRVGDVTVRYAPAGHVLGSAQIAIERDGVRVVVSGDYKRAPDPTCLPFEVVPCDVFITEATFGLPVFTHPDTRGEVRKLLDSVPLFPERAHIVGAYALGKAQRVMALLREEGWDRPIHLHGAMEKLTELYKREGIPLGETPKVVAADRKDLHGAIVICPPSAMQDLWSRKFPDPVTCFASGWMRVRARARQKGVELPLVISDHSDWPDLCRTIRDTGAGEVWVTHGQEDALVHWCGTQGIKAKPLHLLGYGDDGEAEPAPADAAEPEVAA